jgi:two-component system response regulator MprA
VSCGVLTGFSHPVFTVTCVSMSELSRRPATGPTSETDGQLVLIVEDDRAVREALDRALRVAGYGVQTAVDGSDALDVVAREGPDVLIVDVVMPKLDGLELCRRLRERGVRTPILILTALREVSDRVAGLDSGADDYLVKPFALEELLARVRALLRSRGFADGESVLQVGDLTLDPLRREVRRGDRMIELTKTEFDLLELLMVNAGIVLSRDTIYDRVWDYQFATGSRSLDVYVGYLRRKTEADGEPRLIHTVRDVGYVVRRP